MSPTPPVDTPGVVTHFPNLDAYRAIGMTMVLLAHTAYATGWSFKPGIGPVLSRMDVGLPLFFVISGFLIYRPFVTADLRGRSPIANGRFYRRRALRIVPGYWFALTVVIVFFGLQMQNLGDWLVYYGFAQTFDPDRAFGGITQAWSIGVEVVFYALLPLWVWLTRRVTRGLAPLRRSQVLLAGAALLYLAGAGFRAAVVWADPSWAPRSVFWLPMHLDFFAIGMALAVVSAREALGLPGWRFTDRFARMPAVSWLVALGFFAVVTRFQPPPQPGVIAGKEYVSRQLLYGAVSLFFLLPAMFGEQHRGGVRAFLRLRPLVFLGTVSYGFYLFHLAVLEKVQDAVGAGPFQGSFWQITALTFAGSLVLASVSFYLVERPFLLLKDRRLREVLRFGPWARRAEVLNEA